MMDTRSAQLRLVQLLAERERRVRLKFAGKAETHFHTFFVHFAWPVLNPGTQFIDNWHIGAICEHLEAVHLGQIKRLIVNMPYRMLKSSLISQAFPAWEWISSPHLSYVTASYGMDVATRDAVDCRRIIESDTYQFAWSDRFRMTSDQNVKTRYENSRRGVRTVTATDARGTGFGGNRVIVDDPINVKDAVNSEPARLRSIDWWKGTASTRLNDPANDALIITHQRTHPKDLSGHVLAEELGWEQLILPMRFESKYCRTTSLGFVDPRKEEGELLSPQRLPEATVQEMELRLGNYHKLAQLQQRPPSVGGAVFESGWFFRYAQLPKIIRRKIYVDTAQKKKERNDYSVLTDVGLGEDGKIYVLKVLRGKWEGWELEQRAIDFWAERAQNSSRTLPKPSAMMVEDASSGTGLIQAIRKRGHKAGSVSIPIVGVTRDRDKLTRAYAIQGYVKSGVVGVPEEAPWVSDFLTEHEAFTKDDSHDHDDQVDTLVDAVEDMIGGGAASIFD